MNWSPQQDAALVTAGKWIEQCHSEIRSCRKMSKPIFRMFGYAGTGKTTLAKHLAGDLHRVVYAAFTGKAALMMEKNGCANASTIHGLIYQVEERPDGTVRFVRDPDSAAAYADLIVIDECSMVGSEIATDLMMYGRPILVLGDPAQLPPVKDAGYFTESDPDVMLTEIHRQAEHSPIIRLATATRLGEKVDFGDYGSSQVIRRGVLSPHEVLQFDQVLVGKNDTRRSYNSRLRHELGRHGELPVIGDRLVCLKNDKTVGIFNGGMFTATDFGRTNHETFDMTVASDDFKNRAGIDVTVHKSCFLAGYEVDWRDLKGTQQFDYGYALTCHKSQGSQWDNVIVYDESSTFRDDWNRWLYTAITRASERVVIVK